MPLILTQAQADAVYSAMCALNNVSSDRFNADFPGQPGRRSGGASHVYVSGGSAARAQNVQGSWPVKVATYCNADAEDNYTERYADQAAFATAYGLAQG